MKKFSCKTVIYSGENALQALGDMGIVRLLLVTDPYFEADGTAGRLGALSGAKEVRIYSGVEPDPSLELVARGTALLQQLRPDTVVALGGGSAIDCAKAMVWAAGLPVRLVAIPTTSGSGSEVTDFAILTHQGVKHPLIDPAVCPDAAILDDSLLKKLPPSLIADTGFDVLAHCIEGYVATGGSAVTRALAESAFAAAIAALPRSYSGVLSVRQQLHEASAMAGMAFSQAGLGACHALSHALGGLFHLPHGRLNAIVLPAVIEANSAGCMAQYARLARAAGFSGAADTVAVRGLKNGLLRLRRELELPADLARAGLSPAAVKRAEDQLVAAALADPCSKSNPVPVTDAYLRHLLEEVRGDGK